MNRRRSNGEGNFRERRPGQWQGRVSYTDHDTGKLKTISVSGATRDEAKAKLDERLRRLHERKPVFDSKMTVGEYAARWVATTLPEANLKVSCVSTFATCVRTRIMNTSLAGVRLDKLTGAVLEEWLGELRTRGLAAATRRQAYSTLRKVLATAIRDGLLANNPVQGVKRPRAAAKKPVVRLTPDEVSRLLTAAQRSWQYAPVIELMLHTMLRRGEALALRWEDINIGKRLAYSHGTVQRLNGRLRITSTPKTKKSERWVPLTPRAVEILRKRYDVAGPVFTSASGKLLDPHNLWRAVTNAARIAGLTGVHPHTLRHTGASIMLSEGVPLKAVSDLLGHSSIQVTADLYGHLQPGVTGDAMDALGSVLSKFSSKLSTEDRTKGSATTGDDKAA